MLLVSSTLKGSASAEWWAGVLSNAGTAVIFVVPLYLVTRRLDRHVEAVRVEAVEGVGAVAAQVLDLKADVDKRLDDVARSVTARLRAEQEADARAFDTLAEHPSRSTLVRALAVAYDQGLIKRREWSADMDGQEIGGLTWPLTTWLPRVRVGQWENLFFTFDYNGPVGDIPSAYDDVTLELRALDGAILHHFAWSKEESIENVMVQVGRVVQANTAPSEDFDVAAIFTGLADLLRVAASSPERRPLVQLCPPQWAVTEGGIVSYGPHGPYQIPVHRLRGEEDWGRHMAEKGWVNIESFDEAVLAAVSLFPEQDSPPF